jgi:hypothetical protein
MDNYGSLRDNGPSLVTVFTTSVRERDAALGLQCLMHPRSASLIHDTTTFLQSDPATPVASSVSITPSDMPYILLCLMDGCPTTFTRLHQRGNRGHHLRHHHTNLHDCTCDVCGKGFKRTDARLKHIRKEHPELRVPGPKAREPGRLHLELQ